MSQIATLIAVLLPPFSNNLSISPLFASPAQLYQRTRGFIHADATRIRYDGKTDAAGFDHEIEADGNQLTLIAGMPLPTEPATVAMVLYRNDLAIDTKTAAELLPGARTESEGKVESHEQGVGPAIAYDFGAVSAGFTYAIIDAGEKTEGVAGEASFHYTTFTPGVTYHGEGFELGVVYRPQIGLREPDGSKTSPGSLHVHGQVQATDRLVLGGGLEHLREKALAEDAAKNAFRATFAGELEATTTILLGGAMSYESMSARYESDKNPFNVSSATFLAYGDVVAGPTGEATIGLQLGYVRTGKQSGEIIFGDTVLDTKVSLTGMSVSIAGARLF